MKKKNPISGVILAGGKNSRVNGQNKTFFDIGTTSIFEQIYAVMNMFFDDLIVVTRSPELFLKWDIAIFPDFFQPHCPLNGIYTGLLYAQHPQVFVVACDIPFISQNLIEYMCSTYDTKFDVYYPQTSKGNEPLFAIYSRRCLNCFKNRLQMEKFKITNAFKSLKTEVVNESTLNNMGISLQSFFNVNTSQDLIEANSLCNKTKQYNDSM